MIGILLNYLILSYSAIVLKILKKNVPQFLAFWNNLCFLQMLVEIQKKTISMKMKAAVHILGSLLDVRDQNSGNDVPVLMIYCIFFMTIIIPCNKVVTSCLVSINIYTLINIIFI